MDRQYFWDLGAFCMRSFINYVRSSVDSLLSQVLTIKEWTCGAERISVSLIFPTLYLLISNDVHSNEFKFRNVLPNLDVWRQLRDDTLFSSGSPLSLISHLLRPRQ